MSNPLVQVLTFVWIRARPWVSRRVPPLLFTLVAMYSSLKLSTAVVKKGNKRPGQLRDIAHWAAYMAAATGWMLFALVLHEDFMRIVLAILASYLGFLLSVGVYSICRVMASSHVKAEQSTAESAAERSIQMHGAFAVTLALAMFLIPKTQGDGDIQAATEALLHHG